MPAILQTVLGLLAAAPGAYSQIVALWNELKSGVSASDQATVDAVLKVLEPKTSADIAQLNADTAPAA